MNLEISANLPKPIIMLWLCFEIHHLYVFLIKQEKMDNYCGLKNCWIREMAQWIKRTRH